MMPVFPIYLSNSQDGRVILHPLPRTEKIPAQKCLCSSFLVVFPSFSPSLPVNRLPFSSFSASLLILAHLHNTYIHIYINFLFSRSKNAFEYVLRTAQAIANGEPLCIMQLSQSLICICLDTHTHTLSRMHTHRSSHPVPKEIYTQSLSHSVSPT